MVKPQLQLLQWTIEKQLQWKKTQNQLQLQLGKRKKVSLGGAD